MNLLLTPGGRKLHSGISTEHRGFSPTPTDLSLFDIHNCELNKTEN